MARAVSLGAMLTEVRRRANIENQTGFITDAEIRNYLNYTITRLYNQLVQNGGQEWFRAVSSITTVPGLSAYPLPSDFFELQSVDLTINGVTLTLLPYMEVERNVFKSWPIAPSGAPGYYRVQGGNINFIPIPSGTYAMGLNYYPIFTPFATDGSQDANTFDGINGWEELPIWRAVIYCKEKGDEDSSFAKMHAAELQKDIDAMASNRDRGAPERVTDVRSSRRFYPWTRRGL